MDKAIELIVSWIQKNLKNPKLYVVCASLVVIMALIFPYIDANFFFYNRIVKRVTILDDLSKIDMEKISQSPTLQQEYDAILAEIEEQRELAFSSTISSKQTQSKVPLIKFLSGGILAWIVTLCVPFMNTFENKKAKILAFLLLALFGGFLGWIGYIVPIIINPWVNYIGYPILQIIMLIALTVKPKQE